MAHSFGISMADNAVGADPLMIALRSDASAAMPLVSGTYQFVQRHTDRVEVRAFIEGCHTLNLGRAPLAWTS